MPEDCRDQVRYCLSDRTGELRFEAFEIVVAPECPHVEEVVRELLLGSPLAHVDVGEIRETSCRHCEQYILAVADTVAECQAMFA